MNLIDISRSFFQSEVYPGDPVPTLEWMSRLEQGRSFSLSSVSACVHTATYADAPLHCLRNGRFIDQVELSRYYGPCTVVTAQGRLSEKWARELVEKNIRRILIRGGGTAYLSREAARTLARQGVLLVGTDAQSVGSSQDEIGPHQALLSGGVAVLEGLDLSQAEDGGYILCAFPIKLDGAEGAPVRAVLVKEDEI